MYNTYGILSILLLLNATQAVVLRSTREVRLTDQLHSAKVALRMTADAASEWKGWMEMTWIQSPGLIAALEEYPVLDGFPHVGNSTCTANVISELQELYKRLERAEVFTSRAAASSLPSHHGYNVKRQLNRALHNLREALKKTSLPNGATAAVLPQVYEDLLFESSTRWEFNFIVSRDVANLARMAQIEVDCLLRVVDEES